MDIYMIWLTPVKTRVKNYALYDFDKLQIKLWADFFGKANMVRAVSMREVSIEIILTEKIIFSIAFPKIDKAVNW